MYRELTRARAPKAPNTFKATFQKMLHNPEYTVQLTSRERASSVVLIVEEDNLERNRLRTTVKALGYGGVSDAPTHLAGLDRLDQRKFTHIVFGARKTNMPPKDFLKRVLEINEDMVCIPSSFEPSVDDVFDLLLIGARGYLVKPWTTDSLDEAITMATKGEPMAEAVLEAKDRNEALVAIMMTALDRSSTVLRQAEQFETAKIEIPRSMAFLKRSASLARTFAKGGDSALLAAVEKFCLQRGQGPATRLGRRRKSLQANRGNELRTSEPDEAANSTRR
jgi:DNA-binding NarL/FixJ family response regulator